MHATGDSYPAALARLRRSDNVVRSALGRDVEPRLRAMLGGREGHGGRDA